jgi:pyruvate-formate lyase-activating enzyme
MQTNFGQYIFPSTIDWYGISAGVVFLRGCPVNCSDCQNPQLIRGDHFVSIDAIKNLIHDSKMIISGVVFSGGEPCMQIDSLIYLNDYCRKEGLKTYIHTSGIYPEYLKKIINKVDGVRLDYKPYEQFADNILAYNYAMKFIKSRDVVHEIKDYWISSVALRRNESLRGIYNTLNEDMNHILIVQGNERQESKTPSEMKEEFPGVWIYTREDGLRWNG